MIIERVCSSCFEDGDLSSWIREKNGRRGCDACGGYDSPTVEFRLVAEHIKESIARYYGRAVDQLPYVSAEGGYIGRHWDSSDMLDEVGLSLPRDRGNLYDAIVESMNGEVWCEFDWLALPPDEALRISWRQFCDTVKHKRRFFFHSTGSEDHETYTPASLLSYIADVCETIGLVKELGAGTRLWRARPDLKKQERVGATDFGPPPIEYALQSNRMNPPGIPMLYLASTGTTAIKETRQVESKVGLWHTARPLRILDLRCLPPVPGIFAIKGREYTLSLEFLHDFAMDIMTPVERDDRVHIDYLPSQVVTEFIRDYPFTCGRVDGVAYKSTVQVRGWNVALFLGPLDLGIAERSPSRDSLPSLTFIRAKWARAA